MNTEILQKKKGELLDRLDELTQVSGTEERSLTEAEETEFSECEKKIALYDESIKRAIKVDQMKINHEALGQTPTRDSRSVLPPHDSVQGQYSKNEKRDLLTYKIANVLKASLRDDKPLDGLEGELHTDITKDSGSLYSNKSYVIPYWALDSRRHLNASVLTAGTAAVGKELVDTILGSPIDFLRQYIVTGAAGMSMMSGMTSNYTIPKFGRGTDVPVEKPETDGTRTNVKAGEVSPVTSSISFAPNRLPADVRVTDQALFQASVSWESYLTGYLRTLIAERIEQGILNGAGTGNQPKGMIGYLKDITNEPQTVALGQNGAKLTHAHLESMFLKLDEAFNLDGALSFIINQGTRSYMRQTELVADSGIYLYEWRGNNTVLGYPAYISGNVPKNLRKGSATKGNAIIFGKWSDAMLAMFGGGVEILRNPYIQASYGELTLHASTYWDWGVLRDESFVLIRDALLA